MQDSKYTIVFYTEERWQNWIKEIKERFVKLDDPKRADLIDEIENDVDLACLKVIAKYDKNLISAEEALKYLNQIKEIVLKKIDHIDDDIDIWLESMQYSLEPVFASCKCYIEKTFEKTSSLNKLIKNAIQAEKEGEIERAYGYIAEIGANILVGGRLNDKDIEDIADFLGPFFFH